MYTLFKIQRQVKSILLVQKNDMDPGDQPIELQGLSMVEEQPIARVHPVMSVYKINGQQYGYSGQVINFPQDVNDIATKLPHTVSLLTSMIVVRKEKAGQYADFRVDRFRVQRALIYLKTNNIFYRDIDIEILNDLPIEGNMFNELHSSISNIDSEFSEFDPSEEILGVTSTDAPYSAATVSRRSQIENALNDDSLIIPWPNMSPEPVNEFTTAGYIAMAFPTLFPTGSADLRSPRQVNVLPSEYFQHLIKYKDDRFNQNPRFRFFAMNSMSRWTSLQNGRISIQRNSELSNLTTA